MPPQGRHLASLDFALVLLLGFLWGSPYALTKISLESIPPLTLVAGRLTLAATTLWLVVIVRHRSFPGGISLVRRLFIQGLLSCVFPYTLITFGQRAVESGLAAILNSATPVFVCVISLVWTRHETLTFPRIFGVVVGFSGVVGITSASALLGLSQQVPGQMAIIIATASSAFGVIYGRNFASVAPEMVAAGMLTSAAAVLVPLAFVLETPWHTTPSIASVTALLVNAVIATALGFVIYFRLIRTIGSMSTASTSYIKPAVGVLIGAIFLGEPLDWIVVGGLGAILIGVAAINSRLSASPANKGDSRLHRLHDMSNPAA